VVSLWEAFYALVGNAATSSQQRVEKMQADTLCWQQTSGFPSPLSLETDDMILRDFLPLSVTSISTISAFLCQFTADGMSSITWPLHDAKQEIF